MDTERLLSLSVGNKKRLNQFIELIKDASELAGFNRLTRVVKVPISAINHNGLSQIEAEQICSLVNRIMGFELIQFPIKNIRSDWNVYDITALVGIEELQRENRFSAAAELELLGISEGDDRLYLVLQFSTIDGLDSLFKIQKQISTQFPKILSSKDKKLLLLEKIKMEWELMPKASGKEIKIHQLKWNTWLRESGIDDYYQLENVLESFKEEGLIERFEFIDEYQ